MNNKTISFVKNFSYALSSNLIALAISTTVILLVPKLIGVEDYGYWQLYLFYSSYVGFLHFGWNDGIYLKYGGESYGNINKKLFFSQFWTLVIFQLIVAIAIVGVASQLSSDPNKLFILKMTVLCMIVVNIKLMLIYILQGTNRIKEFAKITMMERLLYFFLILLFLLAGNRHFDLLITADIIGKFISLIYATYCCKEIVFNKLNDFYIDINETTENVRIGIKLMFANIVSMFIIGIIRFGIERNWDVVTFGKVSLTLSISNLIMIFINSVGIIIFPVLRRTSPDKLPDIYITIRTALMVPLLGLLIAYYPIKVVLTSWLPQYEESLIYMALLFPMCVYEGKMALLINTYLKTMRKEKLILFINLTALALSVILTILLTVVFENLLLALVAIVVILAFRAALAEIFLSKILNVSVHKDIFLEMTMSSIFMLVGWLTVSWIGIILYLTAYMIYLLIKKQDINNTILEIKYLIRR